MASTHFHDRPQSSPIEAVELSTFNNGHQLIGSIVNIELEASTNASWHPKLTMYRLLILVTTVGFGVAKAITSYLSLNNVSTTLEWVLGVVLFLFFHFLASYEESNIRRLRWLFHVDYVDYIWSLLAIFDIDRPFYRSDELDDTHLRPRHPPITGYRILVTILVLFFGMLKSAFWYGNHQNEVTTVECVFGVGIVTCLYWLGLYETSSTKVYPWFFHVDYSDKFSHSFLAFSVIGKVTFYIVALAICCGVTAVLYYLTTLFFNFQWAQSMFPLFPIVGYTTSAMIAGLMLSIFISGAGWCCILVFMLFRMAVRSPFGHYVLRMAGPRYLEGRVRSLYVEYWLPPTARLHRTPSFYLRRVLIRQLIRLPIRLLFLYVILLLALMMLWLSFGIATWGAMLLDRLLPVTFTFPFISFVLISLTIWASTIFLEEMQKGFRGLLAEVRRDYTDQGPSLPIST